MSGAVLGVTFLAGIATLGASVLVVRGEKNEIAERKKDEVYARNKLPYDFSLSPEGLDRLQTLRGEMLIRAMADPRMDTTRIEKLSPEAFADMAESPEEIPAILKASSETKQRAVVRKLYETLKADKPPRISGAVLAWVFILGDNINDLLTGETSKHIGDYTFETAMDYLMTSYNDTAFKYRERARSALMTCVNLDKAAACRTVVRNDVFLRTIQDKSVIVKLMSYMGEKSATQIANIDAIKNMQLDSTDFHKMLKIDKLPNNVKDYMKSIYVPRFCENKKRGATSTGWYKVKYDAIEQATDGDGNPKTIGVQLMVGSTGVNDNGQDDCIASIREVAFKREADVQKNNTCEVENKSGEKKITVTVMRAFGYEDTFTVIISVKTAS